MTFLALSPLQTALLALITTSIIVGLYLLKLRHRRVLISSSILWRRVLDERQMHSLWEKLRRIISIIVAATIAFSRIPELTTWAGNDPGRVAQARTQVFHTAFLVGACFAAVAVAVAMLLPTLRPPSPAGTLEVDAGDGTA